MCQICEQWKNKKISSKQAFGLINDELNASNGAKSKHLLELSEQIISTEVPLNETDPDADALWLDENGK